MKKFKRYSFLVILAGTFLAPSAWGQATLKEFNALEINTPLINPFSGLVNYGIESSYGNYLRQIPNYIYPESMVYLRPSWGNLEPAEGKLDLRLLEEIRNNHLNKGAKQWSLRVATALGGSAFKDATPLWVREKGAKGTVLANGGFEPQYGDSIYLAEFESFTRRLAERYDGDPTLAYVDISGFGLYGEWGDPSTKQTGWDKDSTMAETVSRKIIDIYLKAFKRTPLAISTHITGLHGEDRYSIQYALDRGVWLRRDGIGSPFYHKGHKELAAKYWEERPIITEWYGIYSNYNDSLTNRNRNWSGWNFTDAVDQSLDQHGLVAEMSRDLDVTGSVLKHPAFDRLAEKIGYRLVLTKAFFPEQVNAGENLIIRQIWKNQGVAKLYIKYPLRVYLTDKKGREIWSAIDHDFDPTDWKRGEMYETYSTFSLPANLPGGSYELRVALVDPLGKPAIALAMKEKDDQGRYLIGNVQLKESNKQNYKPEPLLLNLARIPGATGHVKVQNEQRPFYYVAPLNDGMMRVSVNDGPGNLENAAQSYGITWDKPQTFNTIKYFAGNTIPSQGGWFERDLWVEVLKDGNWTKLPLAAWSPVYAFDEKANNQIYTIRFNDVTAQGLRFGGYVGRRYSKWASVREIEVYNLNK